MGIILSPITLHAIQSAGDVMAQNAFSRAIGLDNGLWLLPWNDHSINLVEEMEAYVQGQGGMCRNFLRIVWMQSTQDENTGPI